MEVYLEGEPMYRVRYRVFLESGQELESSEDSPFHTSVGVDVLPACVQAELARRSAGERFSMLVTADLAAFGAHDSALIQIVPLGDFPRDIEVKPGALVEFSVGTDGLATGQVLEVNDGQVKVDFNHPMIGKNLRFEVEVLAVIERYR